MHVDKQLAAVIARVRSHLRACDGEKTAAAFKASPYFVQLPGDRWEWESTEIAADRDKLVRAVVAATHDDDANPVTEGWLRSVGFEGISEGMLRLNVGGMRIEVVDCRDGFDLLPSLWIGCGSELGDCLSEFPTRGDVRQLAKMLAGKHARGLVEEASS